MDYDAYRQEDYTILPPALTLAAGMTLADSLLKVAPKDLPPNVEETRLYLASERAAVKEEWSKAVEDAKIDMRPLDAETDAAWRSLYERLVSIVSLPRSPRVAKAQQVIDVLFPNGADFLTLPYAGQLAEMKKRLLQIRAQKLVKAIETLAGPEYLEILESLVADYEKAQHARLTVQESQEPDRSVLLTRLQVAIQDYARQMFHSRQRSDPSTTERFRTALGPLVEMRKDNAARLARAARASAPSNGDATPGPTEPGADPAPA